MSGNKSYSFSSQKAALLTLGIYKREMRSKKMRSTYRSELKCCRISTSPHVHCGQEKAASQCVWQHQVAQSVQFRNKKATSPRIHLKEGLLKSPSSCLPRHILPRKPTAQPNLSHIITAGTKTLHFYKGQQRGCRRWPTTRKHSPFQVSGDLQTTGDKEIFSCTQTARLVLIAGFSGALWYNNHPTAFCSTCYQSQTPAGPSCSFSTAHAIKGA